MSPFQRPIAVNAEQICPAPEEIPDSMTCRLQFVVMHRARLFDDLGVFLHDLLAATPHL